MMDHARPIKLDRPVDAKQDHVLGNPHAEITLVEYGSYACRHCSAMHEVIADLRDRMGDRMRYVFRHRPIAGSEDAQRAAELAEYVSATTGQFWGAHDALMKQGTAFRSGLPSPRGLCCRQGCCLCRLVGGRNRGRLHSLAAND